jgi:tripartite ATP-independent transporter DctM subunit
MMLLLFGAWFLLMIIGVPIGFSMLIAGSMLLLQNNEVLLSLPQRVLAGPNSMTLLAIPFFVFAGNLMNSAGITERVFNFCKALVGHIKGGMGHVNVLGSIIFAGMSGSGAADTAGIGAIEIDAQRKAGYDDDFNVGVTLSSACIGPIIPPSIPMVLYGSLAGVSVGALFMGGVVPGLLMALSLGVMVYVIAKKRNYPCEKRATFKEILIATKNAFWALITPAIILGGIMLGIFTPTEAAVVAVFYALFLGIFVYKELTFKKFREVIVESIETTSVVVFIMSSSLFFSWLLCRAHLPQMAAESLFKVSHNPLFIMLLLNILLLIVGCFMEGLAAITILIPILTPALKVLGINPLYFGVVAVFNLQIGAITPPVGTFLYIMVRVAKMKFEDVVKGVTRWIIPLAVILILITIFPPMVTWLPKLLGYN